jgi:voltage-gated potassium channel
MPGFTGKGDIVETVNIAEQALVALDFKYSKQILAALLPMGLTVILHGTGIELVHRFFKRFGRPVMRGPHQFARTAVIICVVAILLVTHFGGVAVWAAFYYLNDLIKDISHAMNFSFNSYTTMGDSGIVLPRGWIGFGNFESMTGMLMFGWSTAVLADIIGKLHNTND